MKVRLLIDSLAFEIDTRNPRLLAEWLGEKFAEIRWTEATHVRAQAWPSWTPYEVDGPGDFRPDWITDSRFMGYPLEASSPEEFLDALGKELARYREEVPL